MMVVTFYTKPGCHLCEPVWSELLALQEQLEFELVVCNILDDDRAFDRYRYLIPVVEVEDGPLFYAPIDLAALGQTLWSHAAHRSDSRPGDWARAVR